MSDDSRPEPPRQKPAAPATPVLIDCDPGMDDALALIVALKTGRLRVRAVTSVSGNLPAARCYRNIHTVLQLMGRRPAGADDPPGSRNGSPAGENDPPAGQSELPTGCGAPQPLVRPLAHDPFSHGADGLGETGLAPATVPAAPAWRRWPTT